MKNLKIVLFTALLNLSFFAFAQNPIVVTMSPAPLSTDTQQSLEVIIPQTVLKDVKPDWIKYLNRGSKEKLIELNGDLLQTGMVNNAISIAPFNIYSKLVETTGGVRLQAWLDEKSILKQPDQNQQLAMKKYVYDFAVQEYRGAVEKELKTELDKQKKLENEIAALIKEEEKSLKNIAENVRSMERANAATATNNSDMQSSDIKISNQKGNADRNVADPNAAKGAKKTLKELEDDKKDLQKQNEKQGESIDDMNKESRAKERNIVTSKENRALKTEALENQKLVVSAVQVKLDNIR